MPTSGSKYQTREHRETRKHLAPIVAAGDAYCAETVCLIEQDGGSRWINPDQPWHLAHARNDEGYLGPAHERCNTSEGATRGNKARGNILRTWDPRG